MRFRTTEGRSYSNATRDVLAISMKVRAWRIAGWKISTAEDLLAELDDLAARYPIHVRRVACLRTSLMAAIMDSVIGCPEGVAW